MHKLVLIAFVIVAATCSTQKKITNSYKDIDALVSLASYIKTQYPKDNCGLQAFRLANKNLVDSLSRLGISSISIKYSSDTINAGEYFYGNSQRLPDSCIIFRKDDHNSMDKKIKSDLVFYFFAKSKPISFKFSTFKPITEITKKINDSTWVYQSVHQLIGL